MVTGEDILIWYKRSIHQRLSLCKQRWVIAPHFDPNVNISEHETATIFILFYHLQYIL